MESIGITNESGDRKYFTIIPNILIDTLGSVPLALYGQLKKMAGEHGVAYPSHSSLCRNLDITRNTLKKYIKELENENLIKLVGHQIIETGGGEQIVKSYSIVDVWKKNTDYYHKIQENKGVSKIDTPVKIDGGVSKIDQRGVKIITKGYQNSAPNKNPLNKNPEEDIRAEARGKFSIEEEIEKLYENSRRDMNIIALYLEERKPDIQNYGQFQTTLRRHLRPAKDLIPFTDNQILSAIPKAKEITKGWTIETLVKCLTK